MAMKRIEVGTKLYIVGPREAYGTKPHDADLVVHELIVERAGTKEIFVQRLPVLGFSRRLIVLDESYESPFDNKRIRFTAEEAIRYAIKASKETLKHLHQQMEQATKQLCAAEDLLFDLQHPEIEGDGTIDPSIMVITDAPTPEKRCGHIIDLNNEACGNPVPCKRHP